MNKSQAVCSFLKGTFFVTLLFVMVSCHPEREPLRELENFTKDLVTNSDDYSSDEWIAAVKEYNRLEKEIESYKNDYDYKEKQEIAKLESICKKHFRDFIPVTVKEKIESVGYIVGETFEGASEAIDDIFNK